MITQLFNQSPTATNVLPFHILANGKYAGYRESAALDIPFAKGNVVWPANNRAFYCPISLPAAFTVSRFFLTNGNTTGNVDLGLYSDRGALMLSTGSTARSGSSAVQYISVTAKSFPAGVYYLAIVLASTAGNVYAITPTIANGGYLLQAAGYLQEDLGATTLPATMTPVRYTDTNAWNFGFTQSASL